MAGFLNRLSEIESKKSAFVTNMGSLDVKVDGLDTKLDVIISLSLLQNADVKRWEKVTLIKCKPKQVLRKDDEDTGGDENKAIDKATGTSKISNAVVVNSRLKLNLRIIPGNELMFLLMELKLLDCITVTQS